MTDLFSTFKLGKFNLKNRIGVAPMTRISSPKDGVPRKDVLDFLVRRAKNGAAVVYTEAIVTDYESAQGYPRQSRMVTQRQIDAWKPVVKEIQKHGALAVMQMFHCGRIGWPDVNPAVRIISPSPLTPVQDNMLTQQPYPEPDEMSGFDIKHVIEGFVETAKGAVEAGFDGIEIHGAHGYLISQFLSSYTNKREDSYGGTVDNRYRFAHEVISAVRAVVPADKLLLFRISNWGVTDMDVSLFKTLDEYHSIIRMLSSEPIDAISVSTYRYKDDAFGSGKTMSQVTRDVTDKPLLICGGVHDKDTAEDSLKYADIVLSGKSILLNPGFVEDLRSGKTLPLYHAQHAEAAYTDQPLP